ncbi:hypothetical protein [Streptomyces yaizuensis]|uniref:Uncharacterized protein n=1 Tax=Streptomyces yaizuensis TaxID=2989713 RepID=A0AA86M9H9_9ACTN|nr:hypothetical protein [Streptomyces sp. YSPA8]BDT39670.1 hypothetical protein SYYSPA8_37760 [Streptomyces sp. YSPA8]
MQAKKWAEVSSDRALTCTFTGLVMVRQIDREPLVLYSFRCREGTAPTDTTTTNRKGAQSMRTTCEDCGDEIEIDPDGFRTLCGCDVAA